MATAPPEPVARPVPTAEPERVSWWQAIGAVLAGTIVVGFGCLAVLVGLEALHLVPYSVSDAPGNGWPWRIDGAWALVADLGPTLAIAFAFAGVTCWYLTQRNGAHPRRWPLALVAAVVGWLPFAGDERGLIAVSGGGAFCIVVIAARAWSAAERKPMPWSWPLLGGLGAVVLALGAASVAYGTLHPIAITNANYPPTAKLRDGRSDRLDFSISNRGPAAARILELRLVDAPGLRITDVQVGGERNRGRRRDTRTRALKPRTIERGEDLPLFVEVGYPRCRRPNTGALWNLRTFDVRLRVAGTERMQRVVLDDALHVSCRGPNRA